MAKLITTKDKYGISVAARIEPQLAHQIAAKAENLGISMAKMISMLISQGISSNPTNDEYLTEQIGDLQNKLEHAEQTIEEQQQLYKDTAAKFIEAISLDDEKMVEHATVYNETLKQLKNEREYS